MPALLRAVRVRAQAPGVRARARCAAPSAGGGPRGWGAPAIFKRCERKQF